MSPVRGMKVFDSQCCCMLNRQNETEHRECAEAEECTQVLVGVLYTFRQKSSSTLYSVPFRARAGQGPFSSLLLVEVQVRCTGLTAIHCHLHRKRIPRSSISWVLANLVTPLPQSPLAEIPRERYQGTYPHRQSGTYLSPAKKERQVPAAPNDGEKILVPNPSTPLQTTVNYIYIPSSLPSTSPHRLLQLRPPSTYSTYNHNHEPRRRTSRSATCSTVIPTCSPS